MEQLEKMIQAQRALDKEFDLAMQKEEEVKKEVVKEKGAFAAQYESLKTNTVIPVFDEVIKSFKKNDFEASYLTPEQALGRFSPATLAASPVILSIELESALHISLYLNEERKSINVESSYGYFSGHEFESITPELLKEEVTKLYDHYQKATAA